MVCLQTGGGEEREGRKKDLANNDATRKITAFATLNQRRLLLLLLLVPLLLRLLTLLPLLGEKRKKKKRLLLFACTPD